ncbi:MAG: sugar transferase [Actinomycetota bacterium]|nr:sugar transferase [Actinomycetota bacterium]
MKQAWDLDCQYVERRSLVLDLAILGKTVLVVLRRDGAR